jgi:hypothetical protein
LKDHTGDRNPYGVINAALNAGRIHRSGVTGDRSLYPAAPTVRATESASPANPIAAISERLIKVVEGAPGIRTESALDRVDDADPSRVMLLPALHRAIRSGHIRRSRGEGNVDRLYPADPAAHASSSPVETLISIVEDEPGIAAGRAADLLKRALPGIQNVHKVMSDALDDGRIRAEGVGAAWSLFPVNPQETTRRQAKDVIETARKDLGMDPS